jgi:hypothetical protein
MDDSKLSAAIAQSIAGSVIAPAGYGKTEHVARAAEASGGRRLILTHTHAGVDALRKRFKNLGCSPEKHCIETIASWSLRYAMAFPKHSVIKHIEPMSDNEWIDIYESATRLVRSGAITRILRASYSGILVDEYQDCGKHQHGLVMALQHLMPVVIFGDPMQAIFDFKGQKPVEWSGEVEPVFPKITALEVPWRWKKCGAEELAKWLKETRKTFEKGEAVDLRKAPDCVKWVQLPEDKQSAQATITGVCKSVMGASNGGTIVVIANPANANARSKIAKNLAACGFSTIEPVSGRELCICAGSFGAERGMKLLVCSIEFVSKCMTGADVSAYLKAVESVMKGRKAGLKKFGSLVGMGIRVVETGTSENILDLLEQYRRKDGVRLYRRELFYAMRSALGIVASGQAKSLEDAIYLVQTRIRHMGRNLPRRAIGSTLLVKGLEFEHSVVIESKGMSVKDWYVALTRASQTVTIVATSPIIRPS